VVLNTKYCDLVMKGGITSGVVYPLAISELSTDYMFKNIGGTSAGAIAAAITAAAEYGRRKGNEKAFETVASIPSQLGTTGLLLKLFQPSSATIKIFRIVLSALTFQSALARIFAAAWALFYSFWAWALVGAVAGSSVPVALFLLKRGSVTPYLVLGLLWSFFFSAVALLTAAVMNLLGCISTHGFGLCSGYSPGAQDGTVEPIVPRTDPPTLTAWLHEQIQSAAGRRVANNPLTFGDLWEAPAFPGEALQTERMINLQVVTTNLTQGRPYTMPLESGAFYFEEKEFRELFPSTVVECLVRNSPRADEHEIRSDSGDVLYRLPEAKYFPILVAARMSLSFPILLTAVPLYAVDYTLGKNQHVPAGQALTGARCWFSDGGICSNFPIQFFDSPLPRWPTFGINLKAPHPDHNSAEDDLVWLPEKPGSGSQVTWNEFDVGSNLKRLTGFFGAIVNTMQNWRDNIQATAAGYRDRIVHVSLRPKEGGLNLNMPPDLIDLLSKRGRRAGQLLKSDFNFPEHIWARFRLTMCGVQKFLDNLRGSYTGPISQDELGWDYIDGKAEAHHYRGTPGLEAILREALSLLLQASEYWSDALRDGQTFCNGNAPRPEPILRAQPKF
jgi:predicted acylesterase/phospholipase RssA